MSESRMVSTLSVQFSESPVRVIKDDFHTEDFVKRNVLENKEIETVTARNP